MGIRTRAVGHACVEVEVNGLRLLTDPWWTGPSFNRQWHPWPSPRPEGVEGRTLDYVYLSHGHEDHLHLDTLMTLRPGAVALVPESLSGSMANLLRETGLFSEVRELAHGKTVKLGRGVSATCYVNLTDSMLVLDSGDEVWLHGNDALHTSPPAVIDYFCSLLLKKHGRVDTLLLGHSGASWFPNCIRLPGKDDLEAARTRERRFQENFLEVVDRLKPKVAGAFASSFVLLEPHNRWINDVRFDLDPPDEAFTKRGGRPETICRLLLPNDVIEEGLIAHGGEAHPCRERLARAYQEELAAPAQALEVLPELSEAEFYDLTAALNDRLKKNRGLLSSRMEPFTVNVLLRDCDSHFLALSVGKDGASAEVTEYGAGRVVPFDDDAICVELRSEILRAAICEDSGMESIVNGYGAVVRLASERQLSQVHTLLGLLRPRRSAVRMVLRTLRRRPVAAAGTFFRQLAPLAFHLAGLFGLVTEGEPRTPLGAPARIAA